MDELRVADAITEIFNAVQALQQIYRRDHALGTGQGRGQEGTSGDRALQPGREHYHRRFPAGCRLCRRPAEKILAQLNGKKRSLDAMDTFGLYQSGTKVTDKPEILFARLDVKEVLEKVEALKAAQQAAAGCSRGKG